MHDRTVSTSSHQSPINLINIQYSVCFGVIFSNSFYLNTNSSPPVINFAPAADPPTTYATLSLLVVYFILDWVSTNIVAKEDDRTLREIGIGTLIFTMWTIGIWWLGTVVLLSRSDGEFKYFVILPYVAAASSYHVVQILFSRLSMYEKVRASHAHIIAIAFHAIAITSVIIIMIIGAILYAIGTHSYFTDGIYTISAAIMLIGKLVSLAIISFVRSGQS